MPRRSGHCEFDQATAPTDHPTRRRLRLGILGFTWKTFEATRKIKTNTGGLSKPEFLQDEKTLDAVVRNLEVIGEAVKKLPEDFRASTPPWNGRKWPALEIF